MNVGAFGAIDACRADNDVHPHAVDGLLHFGPEIVAARHRQMASSSTWGSNTYSRTHAPDA